MANQTPTNSDEIDLGQLFQLMGKAFNKLFRGFLGFYLYLRKNIFVLGGLVILGAALGYGLNQITTDLMKTEVIVKPNLESRNYLYEVVDEIEANISAKNNLFFKGLGISVENLKGFKVTVESFGDAKDISDQGTEYLELLQGFDDSSQAVSDIVRAEILSKSTLINHKISFYFKDAKLGQEYTKKLMNYINSNLYFSDLILVNNENALKRIESNTELIAQIDALISSYAEKLAQKDNAISDGRISFDNEEKLDIKGLFQLKNSLIKDIEIKKVELKTENEAIKIINFGKPQEVRKALFGKSIVLIPIIFIGVFFLISIIKYLNRKAKEIKTI